MQAVINISSEETRLRPISCTRPTALTQIGGKCLIEHLLDRLGEHSVDEVIILTGYMEDEVKGLGDSYEGMKIKYAKAEFDDGGLKNCADMLQEEFLYFSHLVYSDANFSRLIKFHNQKKAYATILVSENRGGRLLTGSDRRVNRIEEKRLWNSILGEDKGMGIYVLSRDITRFIPREMTCDLFENVFPSIVRAGRDVYALPCSDDVICVEDNASLTRSVFCFLDGLRKTKDKGIGVALGATVEKGALLEAPCYIGKNAHIYKGAKIGAYSHIGEGCIVKEGASVKRSTVLKGCRIGKNVSLRGCTIDENVTIGASSTVLEQAVIGKGTVIGEAVTVRSFVKIWPEKNIEDCVSVSENILWGQKKRTHIYNKGVIEGIVNSDITPRFCTKLGECVGSVFEGGEVGIATSGSASGIMVREALEAGLLAMGCRVKNFGEQPLPITRRGVLFYSLKGGVNITVAEKDGEEWAMIDIVGDNGLDVNDVTKKRMEDAFEKGDFLYPESSAIKESEYCFEYKIHYLKSLVGYGEKKRRSFKILLACPALWGRRLISSAMADFNSSVSMYMPHDVKTKQEIKAFEESVNLGGFDMGFIIDAKCEKLTVVPRGMKALDSETYTALTALVMMKKNPKSKIRVPLSSSSVIDRMAEKYNAVIVRTPSIETESEMGASDDEYVFRCDAVGSLIKLTDYFSDESIETLMEEIPKITIAKTFVEIPKGDIERVMGRIKSLGKERFEDGESIKITLDKGWVVVTADKNREICHIAGEGANYETARELCDLCVDEILKKEQ